MLKFKMRIAALAGAVGICLSALTTPLMAFSLGVGVSGAAAYIEVTGKETLKTTSVVSNNQQEAVVFVPAAYVQVTVGEQWFGEYNGFVLGVERTPGRAELGQETTSRFDHLASNSNTWVEQHAQAELSKHTSYYIETPGFTGLGLFLKAGWSDLTVTTNERLGTGASYGNQDISGNTLGMGFKGTHESGVAIKFEYSYTDYDSISLSSTGSDVASTITADADRQDVKLSIGYNF